MLLNFPLIKLFFSDLKSFESPPDTTKWGPDKDRWEKGIEVAHHQDGPVSSSTLHRPSSPTQVNMVSNFFWIRVLVTVFVIPRVTIC